MKGLELREFSWNTAWRQQNQHPTFCPAESCQTELGYIGLVRLSDVRAIAVKLLEIIPVAPCNNAVLATLSGAGARFGTHLLQWCPSPGKTQATYSNRILLERLDGFWGLGV